eukprot:4203044-Prymnesium_polylepis.1
MSLVGSCMTPQPCPAGSSSSLAAEANTAACEVLVRPSAAAFGGARGSDRRCHPLAQKCSTGSVFRVKSGVNG